MRGYKNEIRIPGLNFRKFDLVLRISVKLMNVRHVNKYRFCARLQGLTQ